MTALALATDTYIKNYIICIASFGYKNMIKKYFNHIEDNNLITPQNFNYGIDGLPVHTDKNEMIKILMKRNKIYNNNEVLLVDDCLKNIINFEKINGNGYYVVSNGISNSDVDRIRFLLNYNDNIKMIVYDADLTLFNCHLTSDYVYPFIKSKLGDLNKYNNYNVDLNQCKIDKNPIASGVMNLINYDLF